MLRNADEPLYNPRICHWPVYLLQYVSRLLLSLPVKKQSNLGKKHIQLQRTFTLTLMVLSEKHSLSLSVGSGSSGLHGPILAQTFRKGSSGGSAYCSNNHLHSFQLTHIVDSVSDCWNCICTSGSLTLMLPRLASLNRSQQQRHFPAPADRLGLT